MDRVNKPEAPGGSQPGFMAQSWLVLVLAIGFGAVLAFVQVSLGEVIAANKMKETLARIPELIWGADAGKFAVDKTLPVRITPGAVSVKKNGKQAHYALYRIERGTALAGWVVRTANQGYADRIEALIGLDPQGASITGLFILEQKETPGLGNKITTAAWRRQFAGKGTGTPLAVTKGGARGPGDIDAVTGATISSRSVTEMVNRTVGDLRGRLTPETNRPGTGGDQ